MKFERINIADRERFDEMSAKDKCYMLYNAYKLIAYLSEQHEIHPSLLDNTLRLIADLGTICGAQASEEQSDIELGIVFKDEEHKKRYTHLCELYKDREGHIDCYRLPVAYLLALTEDTYKNRKLLYNEQERHIEPAGLNAAFQTSTTTRITLLAFNLFTNSTAFCNYDEDGADLTAFRALCTPENIFADSYAPYFWQAIKLRYPDYCEE